MRAVIFLSCALGLAVAVACGDDDGVVDAGPASSRDAGGAGGLGAMGGIDGGGGSGGSGGATGGGTGGISGTSPSSPSSQIYFTCEERPEHVPDAGDDACRACAIEHCCDDGIAYSCFGKALPPAVNNPCYESERHLFSRIRQCAADAFASGTTQEPWYVVADCVWAEGTWVSLPPDNDADVPFQLPWSDNPNIALTRCLVGTFPEEQADEDGGIGPIRAEFLAAFSWLEDDPHPEPNCAEECFPGWR